MNADKNNPNAVKVNKCCESFEIIVDLRCTHVNDTNSTSECVRSNSFIMRQTNPTPSLIF